MQRKFTFTLLSRDKIRPKVKLYLSISALGLPLATKGTQEREYLRRSQRYIFIETTKKALRLKNHHLLLPLLSLVY